jgi:Tfp pilus assembly protein PilX
MRMRHAESNLLREDGMALVMALAVLTVLSIVATGVIEYTSANSRSASYSDATQKAYAAAEAGVNSAVSRLGLSTNNALDPCLLHPPTNPSGTTCSSNAPFQTTYDGGTTTWYGTLDETAQVWTVHSTGSVRNPTGPSAAAVTRTLAASVGVAANQNDVSNTAVWNYIVATGTSNSTTCDVTLANSVQIDEPMYVAGNLCMNNTATIVQPGSDAVKLIVLGKLVLMSPQNTVGTSSQPIYEADVGGGCASSISNAGHACTSADRVYASTIVNTASPLALPTVDDPNAYTTAKPGPKNPCTVVSGAAPTWDNDGTLDLTAYPNGSVPTAFDLTPGSDYACEAKDGSGNIVGQLDWNNATKTLTIKGKMYIDGSAYSNNGVVDLYSGSATLYLSGTLSISNSTKICGVSAGLTCDFSSWSPNSNMLVVVAHGNNGSGYSISMANTTKWQGGFFAANGIDLGQSSIDEGPMFATTINLSNSVTVKPLPAITNLPLGAPISPNTHAAPSRPAFTG